MLKHYNKDLKIVICDIPKDLKDLFTGAKYLDVSG
jgi:hypothetical protein